MWVLVLATFRQTPVNHQGRRRRDNAEAYRPYISSILLLDSVDALHKTVVSYGCSSHGRLGGQAHVYVGSVRITEQEIIDINRCVYSRHSWMWRWFARKALILLFLG